MSPAPDSGGSKATVEVDANECSSAADIDLRMARSASAAEEDDDAEEDDEDDDCADATTGMAAADDEDESTACRGDASAGCAAAANPSLRTLVVRARLAPLP